ncbi:hypothetical protein OHA37_23305 [Streptomyces sp. NBC_00335]|uniref:hypothetical protein n=1 Tax=unclassified Streptomyces TaxID=2593676 RepID=UPI00224E7BE1|nr:MULTISPECIES: hypothetical protein [unclassified Streptomyces]MCX5406789.1 hypothetical protein [Streptomyces sp. NBC_00086]
MSHTTRTSWIARTSRTKILTGCGAAIALVTLTACGGAETTADKGAGTAASKPPKASSSAPAADTGKSKAAIKGSGTFQVGSDVQPGLYRSAGNKADDNCYWERAKDSKGEADSILDNSNVVGLSYVAIAATDKIFKTEGCKGWELVDPKATGTPKAEISGKAGMLKIGVDIAPGTYKSAGSTEDGSGCYWERTKDASGSIDTIIANENPEGQAVVTIAAGDGFFATVDCQDWKKSG